jgi:hypothetical protein
MRIGPFSVRLQRSERSWTVLDRKTEDGENWIRVEPAVYGQKEAAPPPGSVLEYAHSHPQRKETP